MKRGLFGIFMLLGISLAQAAASSSNGAVSAVRLSSMKGVLPQNLIMLLDAGGESSVGGFLTFYLALAVNHKAAPIIVSDTVFFAYLNSYKDLLAKGFLHDWQIFKHNGAGLFVLIPQPYLESQMRLHQELQQLETNAAGSAVYSERELALGLAIDHANIMYHIDSNYDALLAVVSKSVEDKSGLYSLLQSVNRVPLDAVLQLFVQDNQNPGRLNILLSGHGFFEPTQDEQTAYWQAHINQLSAFMQDIISQLPQRMVTQEEIQRKFAELNGQFVEQQLAEKRNIFDPNAEDILKFLYRKIGGAITDRERALLRAVYDDMTEKASHAFSQALSARPEVYIAGLIKNQFIDLLEFLKNKVTTSFLYYTTCFGGGVNLATVEEYLNKQEGDVAKQTKPNFIIAAGAVADTTVYSLHFEEDLEKIHAGQMLQDKYNFSLFFDLLRKFFAGADVFKQDPFKIILASIGSPQPETDSNMDYFTQTPSIYFPGAGIFRAIEVDDDVKVLTNALVKAREAEDGLIDARDKHVVLFYPQDVRVPILAGKKVKPHVKPAFVSMIPGPAVHHIKEITAPNIDYDDFIWHAFAQNDAAFSKTWIVDSLLLGRFSDYSDELLRKYELFKKSYEYFEKYGEMLSETIPARPGSDEKQIVIENLIVQPAKITRSLSGTGDITTVWNVMFKDPVRDLYYIGTIDNSQPIEKIDQYEKRFLTDEQAKALRNELFNLPEEEAYEFEPSETLFEIGALARVLKNRNTEIKALRPSSSRSSGN